MHCNFASLLVVAFLALPLAGALPRFLSAWSESGEKGYSAP